MEVFTNSLPKNVLKILAKIDHYITVMNRCDCSLSKSVTLERKDYDTLLAAIQNHRKTMPVEPMTRHGFTIKRRAY